MAKYTFDQIKRNVAEIANRDHYTEDFIFELMAAYGRAASAIKQLRDGAINKTTEPGAFLQKGVLYFKVFSAGESLEEKVEEMDLEPLSGRYDPRYIIATDLYYIVAKDTVKKTTLDIEIKNIDNEVAFFYGWTGNEVSEGSADESVADRRAADKMKDLYDEIEKENIDAFQQNPTTFRHDLNVFFSRLLFCFFAEDTGLFQQRQFTNSVKDFTEEDGSNLDNFFIELFKSLDSEEKTGMTTPFSDFPYINGSLFDTSTHDIVIPKFSPIARHIMILCADLDWSGVNPDIFGTIFQGIVDETKRDENGMDYTSVPNILKVINPLFMDELREEYDKAFDNEDKLMKLWARISKIKVFDPACGSGNFLIIAYKKLRELEHDIIRRISELKEKRGLKGGLDGYALSSLIKLDHFFGIELEDFPRELAVLSMFIAAHQMNIEFEEEFGKKISIIPLIDMPTIFCANSARIDWNSVCPNNGMDEIYVIGNPPYKGSAYQTSAMKSDFKYYFANEDFSAKLDYIALWFVKGSRYIAGTKAQLCFVSTNSICQGEQAPLLFPKILEEQLEIGFAHTSFRWTNNAKDIAGVTVVIINLRNKQNKQKILFINDEQKTVKNINCYLSDSNRYFIEKSNIPINGFPKLLRANSLTDNGFFNLTEEEAFTLLQLDSSIVKKYVGANEFINRIDRKILWLSKSTYTLYKDNEIIDRKINQIKNFRENCKSMSAKKSAKISYASNRAKEIERAAIIIPRVSSERREYIPMGFLTKDCIIGDSAIGCYNAEPWLFAILESKIHTAWIRTVCGKLETRYRYSSTLGYNTFPCLPLTEQQKEKLNQSARNILFARANHPELTLAEMYDPDKMPDDLRKAHEENDILVDKLYRPTPFRTDEARLAVLFKLYEEMTAHK